MAKRKKDRADKLIDELLAGKTPGEILGRDGLVKELTKRLVERALEGEMTDAPRLREARFGRPQHRQLAQRHDRQDGPDRTAASSRSRSRGTATGTFEPQLVKKRQRRLTGFDEKVMALYARGHDDPGDPGAPSGAVRRGGLAGVDLEGHRRGARGREGVAEPAARCGLPDRLPGRHPPEDAHGGPGAEPGRVRGAGDHLEGHKELLGLWVGENEGAKFWLNVLTELKNRGREGHPDRVRRWADGLPGRDRRACSRRPRSSCASCTWSATRCATWAGRSARPSPGICGRSTRRRPSRRPRQALEAFEAKWDGASRRSAARGGRTGTWSRRSSRYPPEIRKVIYTTNAIESINALAAEGDQQAGRVPERRSRCGRCCTWRCSASRSGGAGRSRTGPPPSTTSLSCSREGSSLEGEVVYTEGLTPSALAARYHWRPQQIKSRRSTTGGGGARRSPDLKEGSQHYSRRRSGRLGAYPLGPGIRLVLAPRGPARVPFRHPAPRACIATPPGGRP